MCEELKDVILLKGQLLDFCSKITIIVLLTY